MTICERTTALVNGGRIEAALAEALKREARERVNRGEFFGFIAFAGLLARKAEA